MFVRSVETKNNLDLLGLFGAMGFMRMLWNVMRMFRS